MVQHGSVLDKFGVSISRCRFIYYILHKASSRIALVNASFFSPLSQDFFQPRIYSKTCCSETSVRA
jgi:hypothetical protein